MDAICGPLHSYESHAVPLLIDSKLKLLANIEMIYSVNSPEHRDQICSLSLWLPENKVNKNNDQSDWWHCLVFSFPNINHHKIDHIIWELSSPEFQTFVLGYREFFFLITQIYNQGRELVELTAGWRSLLQVPAKMNYNYGNPFMNI